MFHKIKNIYFGTRRLKNQKHRLQRSISYCFFYRFSPIPIVSHRFPLRLLIAGAARRQQPAARRSLEFPRYIR